MNHAKLHDKNIIVAFSHDDILNEKAATLEEMGFHISAKVNTAGQLKAEAFAKPCDLIVTALALCDGQSIDALLEISKSEAKPAILIAEDDDLADVEKALQDHVMAYLVNPVSNQDLQTTAYLVLCRFEQFQDLEEENAKLNDQLAARKKLERAKGIVMAEYKFTEEKAYLQIRSLATSKRITIRAVCDFIITSFSARK